MNNLPKDLQDIVYEYKQQLEYTSKFNKCIEKIEEIDYKIDTIFPGCSYSYRTDETIIIKYHYYRSEEITPNDDGLFLDHNSLYVHHKYDDYFHIVFMIEENHREGYWLYECD